MSSGRSGQVHSELIGSNTTSSRRSSLVATPDIKEMQPSMPSNGLQKMPRGVDRYTTKSVFWISYVLSTLVVFFNPEISAWRREQSLKRVFWGYGVLGTIGFGALYFLADQTVLRQILLMFIVAYMVWLLVSIWRSSSAFDNIWSTFARLLVVAWTANTIMVVTFLELDLIRSCFGY